MRTFTSDSFDSIYKEVLAILVSGVSKPIESSKGDNLELRNVILELTDHNEYKIDFLSTGYPERQTVYERYLEKELDWYFNKRENELHFKNTPSPTNWKRFSDVKGKIVSNYGAMILREKRLFGQGDGKRKMRITAYDHCLDQLRAKRSTKQAILHYNLPKHYSKKKKDIPCTVAAQVLIRENKLHMTVFQRSSDVFTGIVYDIPWHCELMKLFIKDLYSENPGLSGGSLTIMCSSLHLYLKNRSEALRISQNKQLEAA